MLVRIFRNRDGEESIAIVSGQPDPSKAVPVRVHSACLTAEVLSSLKCDCKSQLDFALAYIASNDGMVIYLPQEGRGVGLSNKIRAYALQEDGLDTVDANRALGLPDDARSYQDAALILQHLGISRIRLITNNPQKVTALNSLGIEIESRLPMPLMANQHSIDYLRTKHARMGHLFDIEEHPAQATLENPPPDRPMVHVNFALDRHGRTEPKNGESIQLSCDQDWRRVHELRESYAGIVVGARTWLKDDPCLTAREERLGREPQRQPDRVIFAGSRDCRIEPDRRRTFVIGKQRDRDDAIYIEAVDHGLAKPLYALRQHGVNSLLVEGGLTLLRSFVREKLVDRLTIYVRTGSLATAAAAVSIALPELSLERVQFEKFGLGILVSGIKNAGQETLLECSPRQ